METTLTLKKQDDSVFTSIASFENAQRMAQVLVKSSLVPSAYRNNIPNAMIALEMANRIGISPFMVMQNLDVIQGKPSWNSTFIIAILNSCGRFSPMRFVFDGEGDNYGCRAVTTDSDGNQLEGTKIDWKMVKAEGWLNKSGSKWKTMPDQMFQYRAASFFGRIYAPDLLKGMHSGDELVDMTPQPIEPDNSEESERIMHFIEKATTLEELEVIKQKLSPDLQDEYSLILETKKNELNGTQN